MLMFKMGSISEYKIDGNILLSDIDAAGYHKINLSGIRKPFWIASIVVAILIKLVFSYCFIIY